MLMSRVPKRALQYCHIVELIDEASIPTYLDDMNIDIDTYIIMTCIYVHILFFVQIYPVHRSMLFTNLFYTKSLSVYYTDLSCQQICPVHKSYLYMDTCCIYVYLSCIQTSPACRFDLYIYI